MKINTTRPMTPRGNPHHGFTLVELLVTITIIVVLAALIFSITGKIRASAQQATALSAMRQVAVANVAYYTENNGSINVIRDNGERGLYEGGGGNKWFTNTFVGRMQPYLFAGIESSDGNVFQDQIISSFADLFRTTDIKTMAGTPFSGMTTYGDISGIPNPIAVNFNLRPKWGAQVPPRQVSSIEDPSRTLYLSYGRYYFDNTHGRVYTPVPKPGERPRGIYYLPNYQGIFCFLDGHVEMLSPPISEDLFGKPPTN
jgi:prepilin-type N-terminal cleavage/methylation domain-containing protein/prepilin-type processing-associated H-X9-DG protein